MKHFLMFLKHIWEDIDAAVLCICVFIVILSGSVLLSVVASGDTSKPALIAKHISFWIFIPIISCSACYGCFKLGQKIYSYLEKKWEETNPLISPKEENKIDLADPDTCPGCGLNNWQRVWEGWEEPKCPRCNYSRHVSKVVELIPDINIEPESKKLTRYSILKKLQ
jgi:hypothetical protein